MIAVFGLVPHDGRTAQRTDIGGKSPAAGDDRDDKVRGMASNPCRQPYSRAVQQNRTMNRSIRPVRLSHSNACKRGEAGGACVIPTCSSTSRTAIMHTST